MANGGREIPYPDVDIRAVRRYLNQRVNASSLRVVAKEIGVGHTTLDNLLAGAIPHPRIRGAVCAWYLAQDPAERLAAESHGRSEPVVNPSYHLEALVSELDGPARGEAMMRITRALADAYMRMGTSAPKWLAGRR